LPDEHLGRAALYMALSALLFACMGAIVKYASARLPTEMVVFFRGAMGLLALLPLLWRGGFALVKTDRLRMHLTRLDSVG
jgi:drug/metabolite transporter (DMT)-like permease